MIWKAKKKLNADKLRKKMRLNTGLEELAKMLRRGRVREIVERFLRPHYTRRTAVD